MTPAYQNDLRDCRPLDAETERRLALRMRDGDREARAALVASQLRWVARLAGSFCRRRPQDFDDAVGVANCALWRLVVRWDPDRGRLSTFTAVVVRTALHREFVARRRRFDPLRGAARLDARTEAGTPLAELIPDRGDPDAEARRAEREELVGLVREALGRIPPAWAHALRETAEGRTREAVGADLGVSGRRVGQILDRGVREVRKLLGAPRSGGAAA